MAPFKPKFVRITGLISIINTREQQILNNNNNNF